MSKNDDNELMIFDQIINNSTKMSILATMSTTINSIYDVKFTNRQKLLNITDDILIYYSSFVILIGTIFNLINFLCFYRMKKRNSQNIYLGALALSELFNLYINITLPLADRLNLFNLSKINKKWFCIINGYLVEVALLLPVWIMVLLSLERCLSILFPLHKNLFSTRKKAKITLCNLTCVILLWSSFKFVSAGIEVNLNSFKNDLFSHNFNYVI